MSLKIDLLEKVFSTKYTLKKIEINKWYSFVNLTKTYFDEGEYKKEEKEGIAHTSTIEECISEDRDYLFEGGYYFLTKELASFFQKYGIHYFDKKELFQNGLGEVCSPFNLFEQLKKDSEITFLKLIESPELIDSIINIDYSKEEVRKINDNSLINSAMTVERLLIVNNHVKDYLHVIDTLVKNKRVRFPIVENADFNEHDFKKEPFVENGYSNVKDSIQWFSGAGHFLMNAVIEFSDSEFEQLLKNSEEKELINGCIPFAESLFDLDLLNISNLYYGYEESNPYIKKTTSS